MNYDLSVIFGHNRIKFRLGRKNFLGQLFIISCHQFSANSVSFLWPNPSSNCVIHFQYSEYHQDEPIVISAPDYIWIERHLLSFFGRHGSLKKLIVLEILGGSEEVQKEGKIYSIL